MAVAAGGAPGRLCGAHYKWVALSNTTLGMLAATVNASIVLIPRLPSSAASTSTR